MPIMGSTNGKVTFFLLKPGMSAFEANSSASRARGD
jgi:hypothetical protein